MRHKKHLSRSVLLLLISLLANCQQMAKPVKLTSEFPAQVAISWFDLQLKLTKETPGFSPPVASRALGYSGVTLYEALVGGMPKYKSLVGQLNNLTYLPQREEGKAYYWPAVANSALSTILQSLYASTKLEDKAAIEKLEQNYDKQYKAEAGEESFNRSVEYGHALAEAIFEWSKTDGGHEAYLRNFPESYIPPTGPGLWIPTAPNYEAIPLQPYWGQNRPFVIKSGEECAPPAPMEYSADASSPFYKEAFAVYTTVKNLSSDQKEIALFWADNPGKTFTPSGHWISIATQVLLNENANLAVAAETYAKIGIAVADAFIGCWQIKYTYNVIRPISYIQTVIDPAWNNPAVTDPVTTPPFPEYPSGHSVQSEAAATVLTTLFGDNYQFTDNTYVQRGLPARTFDSFYEAADEAALSRLYGGIHYMPSIRMGLIQGKCIGEKVNALAFNSD
jgi:PAP2 superfamily protein